MPNVVGIAFDKMGSQVQCQIVRDLMLLQGHWPDLEISSNNITVLAIANEIGIKKTDRPADLTIVYRVSEWPDLGPEVKVCKRDLKVSVSDVKLDPNPKIGYYLKEQGRDMANLTERYLNRPAPRGKGYLDPYLVSIWS